MDAETFKDLSSHEWHIGVVSDSYSIFNKSQVAVCVALVISQAKVQ